MEEHKNVGQFDNVYKIHTFWPKEACHRSTVLLIYSFNKCLPKTYHLVVCVTMISNKKWLRPAFGSQQGGGASSYSNCDREAQCATGAFGGDLNLPGPGGWRKKYLSCALKDEQEFSKHRKRWRKSGHRQHEREESKSEEQREQVSLAGSEQERGGDKRWYWK